MDKKMNLIKLDGARVPYKCTNNVLAQMQEEHGSIDAFYLKLIGREPVLDEDGYEMHNEEGKRLLRRIEPSIRTINRFFVACVQEGLEIEGKGRHWEEKELIRMVEQAPFSLVPLLAEEFNRSFLVGGDEKKD